MGFTGICLCTFFTVLIKPPGQPAQSDCLGSIWQGKVNLCDLHSSSETAAQLSKQLSISSSALQFLSDSQAHAFSRIAGNKYRGEHKHFSSCPCKTWTVAEMKTQAQMKTQAYRQTHSPLCTNPSANPHICTNIIITLQQKYFYTNKKYNSAAGRGVLLAGRGPFQ